MNAGIFIAALAFIMLLLGGLPLLLLGIVLFAAWFAWQVFFQKEPDDNPNGFTIEGFTIIENKDLQTIKR